MIEGRSRHCLDQRPRGPESVPKTLAHGPGLQRLHHVAERVVLDLLDGLGAIGGVGDLHLLQVHEQRLHLGWSAGPCTRYRLDTSTGSSRWFSRMASSLMAFCRLSAVRGRLDTDLKKSAFQAVLHEQVRDGGVLRLDRAWARSRGKSAMSSSGPGNSSQVTFATLPYLPRAVLQVGGLLGAAPVLLALVDALELVGTPQVHQAAAVEVGDGRVEHDVLELLRGVLVGGDRGRLESLPEDGKSEVLNASWRVAMAVMLPASTA